MMKLSLPRRSVPADSMLSTFGSRGPRASFAVRWSGFGLVFGLLLGIVVFAPASWLAHALAAASSGHVLITDTRGTIWGGSGVLVLTGGKDARDASALPGRVSWRMGIQGTALSLKAAQECCINGELALLIKPGLGRVDVAVESRTDWLARFPAAWLAGVGTPFNTLQLGGSLRLSSRELRFEWVQGRLIQHGEIQFDLVNISSRVSTLAPLGSYRFSVQADPANPGSSSLRLSTLEGGLLLSGQGVLTPGGKSRFTGEASAAPGREEALNNLLNIIGRRQGPRSVLTIG